MSKTEVIPELRQILGALLFGAGRPLPVNEMRKCLREVSEASTVAELKAFGELKPRDLQDALDSLREELERTKPGFFLAEVAAGYCFQSDPACGMWLKQLLNAGKPNRLSQPALETLAIIAYRQPLTRADIEGVRGVNVDHMVKQLMELQLVKITGRSELPGKPFLYGTTQAFLEHFGLKGLKDLDDIEPMLRMGRPKAGDTKAYQEPLFAADAEAAGEGAALAGEGAAAGGEGGEGKKGGRKARGAGRRGADADGGAPPSEQSAEAGGEPAAAEVIDHGWSADTGDDWYGDGEDEGEENALVDEAEAGGDGEAGGGAESALPADDGEPGPDAVDGEAPLEEEEPSTEEENV